MPDGRSHQARLAPRQRGGRSRHKEPRLDEHWLRSLLFTVGLVGLVAVAAGADWSVAIGAVATCCVGFGFFYLLFPGGAHFGMTVANFLAIYACQFEFFRSANFATASRGLTLIGLALPVVAFLVGCLLRRRAVGIDAGQLPQHPRDRRRVVEQVEPHEGRDLVVATAPGAQPPAELGADARDQLALECAVHVLVG
ncbi:MAG: hypothetical protein J0H99_26565, partial [Rhodospirillales bacterium]|nr:hypothetical protein [Rhodospirillales bacterium]